MPLFAELQACKFSAIGITCLHKELPLGFKVLKAKFATKLKWNTLLAKVVNSVLCLA